MQANHERNPIAEMKAAEDSGRFKYVPAEDDKKLLEGM